MNRSSCSLYAIVYGPEYVKLFLDISLASQLTPGNIPALVSEGLFDYEYVIFTRKEDEGLIRNHPVYQRLAAVISTKIEFVEFTDNKRLNGAICHKYIIDNLKGPDPAFIYITVDVVYSSNSLFNLVRPVLEGKTMVLIGAIRSVKETMLPALQSRFIKPDKTLEIDGGDLVELCLDKLHYLSTSKLWNDRYFTFWPSYILWSAGEQGLVQSYLHLCPMLVRTSGSKVTLYRDDGETESFDSGYYIEKVCPNSEKWAVMNDSRKYCQMELVAEDYYSNEVPETPVFSNPIDIALWIKYETNPVSRAFAKTLLNYRTHKAAAEYERVYQEASSIMKEILGWLDLFDRFPEAEISLLKKVLVTKHGEISMRMERLGQKYGVNLHQDLS